MRPRRKPRPELEAIRQNQMDSIRAMLSPEQRTAYETL